MTIDTDSTTYEKCYLCETTGPTESLWEVPDEGGNYWAWACTPCYIASGCGKDPSPDAVAQAQWWAEQTRQAEELGGALWTTWRAEPEGEQGAVRWRQVGPARQ